MNKPNLAPEPTMEEILASIRRIISEGDEGGASGVSVAPLTPKRSQATDEAAPVAAAKTSAQPEARAYDTPVPQHTDAIGQGVPPTPETARDEAIFELTDDMVDDDGAAPPSGDLVDAPFHVKDQQAAPESASMSGGFAETTSTGDEFPPFAERPVDPAPSGSAVGVSQPDTPAAEAAPQAEAERPAAVDKPKPADSAARQQGLLSPQSDAKVASAFSQLASTILTRDSRTLEDLVGEMLRPMLKEWLDDNLPVIVERLVREEIQRVSRG